ncbi:hypothetical protein DNX69_07650 [Rhodopseudomonas palustris]|uniref:DUF2190 family protein n=1 Tax=Rhodopseudomonas palustris TaxID=1076 RepID=A0A323UNW2_RHOPL|nr:capsid cement protein [Rhodopseudomonas palustris]PZA12756.1 hypothetical protein DNX69_07650 [Rhodopseudomonas palustris]
MKNYLQSGDAITVPAPADVKSGNGVVVGALFGIAATDAASGADVVLSTTGVYTLPKVSAQAWTRGVPVFWDAENGVATTAADDGGTPATDFLAIGHAVAPAANPSATGDVRLSI